MADRRAPGRREAAPAALYPRRAAAAGAVGRDAQHRAQVTEHSAVADAEPARSTGRITTDHGRRLAESIEGPFLRVARRYSLCDDDAWDALASSFEIALRHRDRVRPETAAAWFATVVRHEAMRIRRSRSRDLQLDPATHDVPADEPEPEREHDRRLPALRAAMRRLKPDERRALILFFAMDASRGDGGRYRRIMRATGWSYTKVNRCLTEGRAALRAILLPESVGL